MTELHFWLAVLFYSYLAITTVILLLDNREPAATIAWLLVFIFLPVVGFALYLFIGRNWRKHPRNKQLGQEFEARPLRRLLQGYARDLQADRRRNPKAWRHPCYQPELLSLSAGADSVLTVSNRVDVYHSGKKLYAALIEDLRTAQSFICLEYFIWRNDALTRIIRDLLKDKARAGVRVKILIDTFGSWGLGRAYFRELIRAGARVHKYYRVFSPLRMNNFNYRNHRKIAVIDGRVGYTGGMNIGEEYVTGGKRFPSWRDLHLRLRGPAVTALQAVFAVDWFNATHEDLLTSDYFPLQPTAGPGLGSAVQITTSGPDSRSKSIQQIFFIMITSAEKNLFIQSPYFVPDPGIQQALVAAGLRGVDVRFMMTGLPDNPLCLSGQPSPISRSCCRPECASSLASSE